MPRPKNALAAKKLHVAVPGQWGTRLDLLLYSPTEQRIPFGAHQRFLVERIREFFERDQLDLKEYFPDAPDNLTIFGNAEAISFLKAALSEQ